MSGVCEPIGIVNGDGDLIGIVPGCFEIPKPVTAGQFDAAIPEAVDPLTYDYDVKSWPQFFSKMITGQKKHDMRNKRDRSYKVGDKMLLREFDPFGGGYTGRFAVALITYITSNDTPCALSSVGLGDDMAILSLEILEVGE